jgi:ABC-type Mn2+/Zn2+ transport system ATPase subunit
VRGVQREQREESHRLDEEDQLKGNRLTKIANAVQEANDEMRESMFVERERGVSIANHESTQDSQYLTGKLDLADMNIKLDEKGMATPYAELAESTVSRSDVMHITPKSFRINLKFEDLGLQLPNGKKVMEGVSGEIKAGTVTAVMGPSGAGKTTFLATLAGRAHYGKKTGRLLINDVEGELTDYSDIVGFVPQEDIMLRSLSVRELLTHSADMLLEASWTARERNAKIKEVIRVLDLYAIRHSKIGDDNKRGISGGQRKRVNIGLELVGNPTVLLLDEPTSGLDSTSSKEVCGALRLMVSMLG